MAPIPRAWMANHASPLPTALATAASQHGVRLLIQHPFVRHVLMGLLRRAMSITTATLTVTALATCASTGNVLCAKMVRRHLASMAVSAPAKATAQATSVWEQLRQINTIVSHVRLTTLPRPVHLVQNVQLPSTVLLDCVLG